MNRLIVSMRRDTSAEDGWIVEKERDDGREREVLARFCGGNIGREFGEKFAHEVGAFIMADEVHIHD